MNKKIIFFSILFLLIGCSSKSGPATKPKTSGNRAPTPSSRSQSNKTPAPGGMSYSSSSSKAGSPNPTSTSSDYVRIANLYCYSNTITSAPNLDGKFNLKLLPYEESNYLECMSDVQCLLYYPTNADISKYTFKYYSSNEQTLKFQENTSHLETHRPGSSMFTLKAFDTNGVSIDIYRTWTVLDSIEPTSFSIAKTLILKLGEMKSLEATINPNGANSNNRITYTVSNNEIIKLSGSYVTGLKPGVAVIDAKLENGMVSRCVVRVTATNATSFRFDPSSLSLPPNATQALSPYISYTPSNCDYGKGIKYSSSDTSIAKITDDGKVITIKPGTCTITGVLENGYSASAVLQVTSFIPAETISITQKSLSISINESSAIPFAISPTNANSQNVPTWFTSDPSIAKVENGLVIGVSRGECTITAMLSNRASDTCSVTVDGSILPTELKLSETSISMNVGGDHKLTAVMTPTNADAGKIKWSSSNASVASVDANGNVHANKTGSAIITASVNGLSASCSVSIKTDVYPTSLSVDSQLIMDVGESKSISYKILPSNANKGTKITWSSSNESIAKVVNGNVTGVGYGECIVTGTLENGVSGSTKIIVQESQIMSLSISSQMNVLVGQYLFINPTVSPSNARIDKLIYSSSNPSIARVDEYGCVFGISSGNAVITVRTPTGIAASCSVSVSDSQVRAETISISGTTGTINVGEQTAFVYTISPANSVLGNQVTWVSYNASVAKVDSFGVITGISKGTASIKASLPNGYSVTIQVTVQ